MFLVSGDLLSESIPNTNQSGINLDGTRLLIGWLNNKISS